VETVVERNVPLVSGEFQNGKSWGTPPVFS
jgi:hypothetical protein